MRLPTRNHVTCDMACHKYPATDYSWHISKYNYIPRKKIYAIEDGTVTYAGDTLGDCGQLVELAGQKQRKYGMCHLSSIRVKAGQKVKEGDVIGIMGTTGKSTGIHLHLRMSIDGRPVNPDKTIKKLMEAENMYKGKTAKEWYKRAVELGKGRNSWRSLAKKAQSKLEEIQKILKSKTLDFKTKEAKTLLKVQESEAEIEKLTQELAKADKRAGQTETEVVEGFFGWLKNLFINRSK